MSQITHSLDAIIQELQSGKPAAIPTETVYGLAAPINNERALQAVFDLKKRPVNHPLIMHVHPDWDLNQWVEYIPDYAKKLMKAFWPGPLTLILRAKENIHPLITGGQPTVAVRSPNHPLTLQLLHTINIPLVAPSANPFGKISPTIAEHVQQAFYDRDLWILDGGRCEVGIESTILNATHPDYYQIERPGMLSHEMLEQYISIPCNTGESDIRTPGKMEQHYQPQKPLYYFESQAALESFCKKYPGKVYVYNLPDSPESAAFALYFDLRKADETSAEYIALVLPSTEDAWAGVRERIMKAGKPGE